MKKIRNIIRGERLHFNVLLGLFIVALAFGSMGCEDPLDVENPNSLIEDDLFNPTAANAVANGALATSARGIASVLAPYLTAGDEVVWTGSRDDWRNLDFGNVSDPANEFTDDAMKDLHEGRWMADKAISVLSQLEGEGTLPDRKDLARAYLYAAATRVYIADWFDDWVFSDKTDFAANVGEANMKSVYNDAISSLDQALAIARSEGGTDIEIRALALRARAKHASAIWDLLNPKGSTPSNPLVNAGTDDAAAALALMADDNYKWQFFYAPGAERNDFSWQVNGRLELQVVADPNGEFESERIPLMDPIDNTADPRALAIIADFTDTGKWNGESYAPLTVISAREMRLIIAEGLLASGNTDAAKAELNTIRALDGMTAITTESVQDMLIHERRANLHLTGRRLNDMYRFGIKDPMWQTTSDAFTTPGAEMPITDGELQANPLVSR
jgi:hypothetical protein